MSPAASPAVMATGLPLSASRPALPVNPQTRAALEEFEAVLIGEMVNVMLSTVPTDGYMGGGNAEEIYRSMMGQEMGREIARQGGLGIAPALMNEIVRLQGGQP
ncbi:rod-binding protein [Pedomonas sp. V897]|uniref:rod-binding protein n=1 Tax=Pedomonas sp. V897 TaxID=3446482 RepID=UPI003EDF8667